MNSISHVIMEISKLGIKLKVLLSILIWATNSIMKSITKSFIMLNTITENKITGFANISTSFVRSCSQYQSIVDKKFS